MQCSFSIFNNVLYIYTGLAGQLRKLRPGKAATPRTPRMATVESTRRADSARSAWRSASWVHASGYTLRRIR